MNPFSDTQQKDLTELMVIEVDTPTSTSVKLTFRKPEGSAFPQTHHGKVNWMSVFSDLVKDKLDLSVNYEEAKSSLNNRSLTIGGLSPDKLDEETWKVLHGIVEEVNKEAREVWDFMERREKLAEKFLIGKDE